MLKVLELVGFKSFADRTRFDFPDGITVVVGPNGSGKSNVVDAVKWVLGAQSAKALRGADMTDVIFKGSAEGGRKPANSAEVVLVLDNRTRILTYDEDEVQVSRRVYRSGEGEYAINGRPCRLKDVRELFRGTGVGVDAYSLIEQGKVDRLLQSSAKDRRGIFEEAAGISRFKAKKAEAERRLGRVDQNMIRLRDIVDEVGKRLSTLKSQASKAQRYRELSSQLIVKRTQLGLIDVRDIQKRIEGIGKQLAAAATQRDGLQSQSEATEGEHRKVSELLTATQEQLQKIQDKVVGLQSEHIQATSELAGARQRHSEWTEEQKGLLNRIETLERRVSMSEEEIQQRQADLYQLDRERQESEDAILLFESQFRQREKASVDMRESLENKKGALAGVRQILSQTLYDAASHEVQHERLVQELHDGEEDIRNRELDLTERDAQIAVAAAEVQQAQTEATAADTRKAAAKEKLAEVTDRERCSQQKILEIQARIQGVHERLLVLSQLEEQFASAGRGGQQLMRSAQSLAEPTPSMASGVKSIRGLVADLITTDLHLAPLVDVALGTHADAIVLSDGQLVDWINEGRLQAEGRVTLLRLDRLPSRRSGEKIQLDGLRGVVGRADRLVRFDSEHEPLVRALLGTTWFVETLSTALDLSHFRGAGLRFVTAECQLVDSDGSITIGSLQTGLGLVSRRSEMQAANEQIDHLQQTLEEERLHASAIATDMVSAADAVHSTENQVYEAGRQLAAAEQRLHSLKDRMLVDRKELSNLQSGLDEKRASIAIIQQSLDASRKRISELETTEAQHAETILSLESDVRKLDTEIRDSQNQLTDQRVDLARLEQRVDGMRVTLEQLLHDATERASHVEQAKGLLATLAEKIRTAETSVVELQDRIASTDLQIASILQERVDIAASLELQQRAVTEKGKECDQIRRQLDKLLDRIAAQDEELQRLQQERNELICRYRDEYQVDLEHEDAVMVATTELDPVEGDRRGDDTNQASNEGLRSTDAPEQLNSEETNITVLLRIEEMDRNSIEPQLIQLRQEIASAGSVNMEALDELDELQARYDKLVGHERDLIDAKSSLIKTMQKIDEDSQDLFLNTLETIRTNFQTLYRKSFGGGSADIVLENPDDPESGIEIIATPPGKTTFSNSLLSGGEKALTAVALIMAFFQYRPSPFCILDEVDAPFDEANIGRFVTVLNEFLDTTKFIVVTHSKKTMTVANMIYGITMQESGVSRQVAVKFEEVNDQGEIVRRENRRAA
ncbi:MAG: chromosome segregation protein SMC [Planctomycetes bacterium]|nr:chromosome segregation protein SMC [Planctomycetota bacterium]